MTQYHRVNPYLARGNIISEIYAPDSPVDRAAPGETDFLSPGLTATQNTPTFVREAHYASLGDEELMQSLSQRDLEAFRTLYERYGNLVYSTCVRVVRDSHVAEDMVQEIFLRIWRKPDSFTSERGRFVTWLTSVTRNRAVDEFRSRNRRFRHETAAPENQEREAPGAETSDPALRAELSDQRRLILAAMADLPEEQREVITLAYFGGFTQQEISDRLSQPLGTVKTRIRLGMEKLRLALTSKLKVTE
jgi:RNA polymerase sigma-70 factor (ECF subfamily)